MLTNAAVKAARGRAAAYKLADERGLHLYVATNGRKTFRLRFRISRGEQLLTIGAWPEVTLDQAREHAERARELLAQGKDPRVCEIAQTEVRRFEAVARCWHDHMRSRWTVRHAEDVLASLERDVFPAIGDMPLAAITPPVVLNALRLVEARGRRETARRVRQRISMVFCYAMGEGWAETDPAAIVGRALMPPAPARHQPALLELADARDLLAVVDQLRAAAPIKLASQFLALTAVRLAAVRGACWSEIEDLDGPAPLWRVPAARMKLAAAKKNDSRFDHLVPLAPAAVEVLRAARANMHSDDANMHGGLVFPGRCGSGPIGEAAIGALYDRAGFAGRHVPHGWRATFSTVMNEHSPELRGQIDRALGHAGGKRDEQEEGINRKVEGAYNRAQHLGPRRSLFEAWAAALVG